MCSAKDITRDISSPKESNTILQRGGRTGCGCLVASSQDPEPLDDLPRYFCQDAIALNSKMTTPGRAVRAEILTNITILHLGQEQRTQIDRLEYPMVVQQVEERSIAPLPRSLKRYQVPGGRDHEDERALPVSSGLFVKMQ
jgi:hypothetical protein